MGLLALVALAFAFPAVAQADWEQLNGRLDTSGASTTPSDIAEIGGQPWVAWVGGPEGGSTGAQQVHVKRWTGAAWELVGGPLNTNPASLATSPKIVSVGGVAHVAWFETDDGSGGTRIAVAKWDSLSSAWVAVGGSLLDAGQVLARPEHVGLAAIGGEPYVTWSQRAGGTGVTKMAVKRFTAGSWQAVGTPNSVVSPTTYTVYPELTGIGGTPYLVFVALSDASWQPIRVASFTGGSWSLVGSPQEGTSPDSEADGAAPQIAELDGQPAVLWFDVSDGTTLGDPRLRMTRWNGTTWADVGPPIQNPAPIAASPPALVVIDDIPYVAWVHTFDTKFLATAFFNGSAWVDTGEAPRNGGTFGIEHPALADVGGAPHLTWTDYDSTHRLYAARLELASIQLSASTYDVDEDDGSVTVSVERTGSTTGAADVHFAFTDGTATGGGVDYNGGSGSVHFDSGDTTQALLVSITDDGLHESDETATIALSNPAGATLGTPSSATLTIHDDDAIDTQIFGGPSGPTNSSTASFAFTATPSAGATFECSLDGATFAACPSVVTLSNLSQGSHEFKVRAKNATATDTTPAIRTFFVDTVAPTSTILLTPNGGSQLAGDSRYSGKVLASATGSDPAPASGVAITRCVLDPPSVPAQFIEMPACSAATAEAPGLHTFYAASQDLAGNVEPVVVRRTFTIVPAPDTTITSGPTGVAVSVPSFTFTSNVPGSRFECRIDSGPFVPCTSSAIFPYKPYGLSQGDHTLFVRATSPEGLVDPTPASRLFTLGEQKLTSQCSFRIPYASSAEKYCVAKRAICPLGSVCTRTGEVNVVQGDTGISYSGIVSYAESELPGGGGSPNQPASVSYGCSTPPSGKLFTIACPYAHTDSVIGKGQAFATVCGIPPYGSYGLQPSRGPDEARGLTCKANFTIRPATALEAGTAGTSVSVVVPGPGSLGVGPLASPHRALYAAERKGKPAFTPITREVAGEGVEELTLKLVGKAKKKLKKKHKLALTLEISFTPTEGESISRTQKVVLTSPCKPTKKRPFC